MDQNITLTEKAKNCVKNMPDFFKTKKGKKAIIAIVVLVLIIAILSGSIATLNNDESNLYSNALLLLMPSELEDVSTGVVYYVEKNENYDPKKNVPLDAYLFYYFDDDGNRIDVPNGFYTDENGTKTQVSLGFIAKALQRVGTINTVFTYIMVAVFFALFVVSIYIAYRIWLKKELANDAKLAKNNNKK